MKITGKHIIQAIIFVTGAIGAALLARGGRSAELWGYAILLCGQPLWIIETLRVRQWGMLALAMYYTAIYAAGALVRILSEVAP